MTKVITLKLKGQLQKVLFNSISLHSFSVTTEKLKS